MSNDVDFQWKIFENVNRWVTQADTKAAGLLATDGVVIGMIFTHLDTVVPIAKAGGPILWLCIAGVSFLLISAFLAICCVKPRLAVGEPNSLIFFQHIAQYTTVDYAKKLKAVKPTEQAEEITHQIWANSKVAVRKHKFVLWSIRSLLFAAILLALPIVHYACTFPVGVNP